MEATVSEEDGLPGDVRDEVAIRLDGLGVNAGVVWKF
jgi:hypothetical protein